MTTSLNSQPSTLNFEVRRHRHTRWGVDGQLSIDGRHIADTTEHPTNHLATGEYPLSLDRLLLKKGNGPMLNTDGSICVGERLCAGCILRTRELFTPIYNRIQKALKREKSVILTIQCMLLVIFLTGCSTAIREILREYKYQFLKYTVRVASVDSIPVIHEVEVVKTERYIPSVYKWSLGICIVLIVIILAIIAIRVIREIRVR